MQILKIRNVLALSLLSYCGNPRGSYGPEFAAPKEEAAPSSDSVAPELPKVAEDEASAPVPTFSYELKEPDEFGGPWARLIRVSANVSANRVLVFKRKLGQEDWRSIGSFNARNDFIDEDIGDSAEYFFGAKYFSPKFTGVFDVLLSGNVGADVKAFRIVVRPQDQVWVGASNPLLSAEIVQIDGRISAYPVHLRGNFKTGGLVVSAKRVSGSGVIDLTGTTGLTGARGRAGAPGEPGKRGKAGLPGGRGGTGSNGGNVVFVVSELEFSQVYVAAGAGGAGGPGGPGGAGGKAYSKASPGGSITALLRADIQVPAGAPGRQGPVGPQGLGGKSGSFVVTYSP